MVQRKLAPKRRLQKLAEDASSYFMMGFESDNVFDTYEEAKAAWELVKERYYKWYPIGEIDRFGYINYLPEGYWLFDCPGAPFQYEEIEGLGALESHQHQKHLALQKWGIIPKGTPDPQLINEAQQIERLYQTRMSGNLDFLPFPTGTSEEKMEAKFEEVKAERAAWVKLGYLKGGNNGD
jgi:hypothetical protein